MPGAEGSITLGVMSARAHESVVKARVLSVEIARRVLAGQESPLLAARRMRGLRSVACIADEDRGFDAFDLIESETDALPIGDVRKLWSASALAEMDPKIARAERWAMESCREAFENVVLRVGTLEG